MNIGYDVQAVLVTLALAAIAAGLVLLMTGAAIWRVGERYKRSKEGHR
jgi:hypothetical protein